MFPFGQQETARVGVERVYSEKACVGPKERVDFGFRLDGTMTIREVVRIHALDRRRIQRQH